MEDDLLTPIELSQLKGNEWKDGRWYYDPYEIQRALLAKVRRLDRTNLHEWGSPKDLPEGWRGKVLKDSRKHRLDRPRWEKIDEAIDTFYEETQTGLTNMRSRPIYSTARRKARDQILAILVKNL